MLWTIEVNLDADVTCCTAYHIAAEDETVNRHISFAISGHKFGNWVYIGIANSYEEAREMCFKLQALICEKKGMESQTGFNKHEQRKIREGEIKYSARDLKHIIYYESKNIVWKKDYVRCEKCLRSISNRQSVLPLRALWLETCSKCDGDE